MPRGESAAGEKEATETGTLRRKWRSRRVVVEDESMLPALRPGDRLLVDPTYYRGRRPARGDVVVLRDPERPGRLLVKRVGATEGEPDPSGAPVPSGTLYLIGDDPARSRDSRSFGPVPLNGLVGRVWFRYAPGDRRGPVNGERH
ncbi:MAG: S26 family signal peptidase [Thermoplasmata archaeon]